MKLVVETKGRFQLLGDRKGERIHAFRPTVIEKTPFIDVHMARNELRVLGEVDDEATDQDLADHLKADGTVESFIATYAPEPAKPAPKLKGKGSDKEPAE